MVNTPAVVCDEPLYEFDKNEQDNVISNEFVLCNNGTAELVILDIRACCGATAYVSQRYIQPGGNVKLYASLNVGKNDKILEKSIYVQTNDPGNRYLRLAFKERSAVNTISYFLSVLCIVVPILMFAR